MIDGSKTISLASGASVTIEETEALTAIDIDAGAAPASNQTQIDRINFDAIETIARQTRNTGDQRLI